MLVAVGYCAVAIAALLNASEVWLAAVTTFTMLLFMIEVLVAIYFSDDRRAFAVGFLAWGAMYFAIDSFLLRNYSSNALGTGMALQFVFELLHPETKEPIHSHSGFALGHTYELYMHIGEFLWTLILGGCGGLVAQALWRRKEREGRKVSID